MLSSPWHKRDRAIRPAMRHLNYPRDVFHRCVSKLERCNHIASRPSMSVCIAMNNRYNLQLPVSFLAGRFHCFPKVHLQLPCATFIVLGNYCSPGMDPPKYKLPSNSLLCGRSRKETTSVRLSLFRDVWCLHTSLAQLEPLRQRIARAYQVFAATAQLHRDYICIELPTRLLSSTTSASPRKLQCLVHRHSGRRVARRSQF